MTTLRVASDVGGTFTDSIAYDQATGVITVSKISTTPENRAVGTTDSLKEALALQGKSGADVSYVGHGMTTATNAVIQRKGAKTAFLTNRGFRDLLLLGRSDRPSHYDTRIVRPPQLVPRERCYTVGGRIDASGREVERLDESAMREIAQGMKSAGVEAVAILFLHSYANPSHECRAKELLGKWLPGVVICASTDILSEFREFERASTTVLNAFLMPVMDRYLGSLVDLLRDTRNGLGIEKRTPVMVMEAAGGLMTVASAREKPVQTLLSGPAGGVVASAHVAALAGSRNIITMDIGGTSTDISLIRDGRPEITRQAKLETTPIRLPVLDIHAIGAGGGSIAWIDDGGALRVGPMSAEAVPGPACYRRGGQRPTVTDANVVLRRLGADTRLGGHLTLDAEAAHRVIAEVIAEPLGLDVVTAAAGVLRVAHSNIVRGIRVVSVERGYDPRDFVLVPFGGAGPMHGTPVARELSMKQLLIPPIPGIVCALGMLVSDLRHDLLETFMRPLESCPFDDANVVLERLHERANALLANDNVPPPQRRISVRVDLRYVGQSYELSIELSEITSAAWLRLGADFHSEHKKRFGHADPAAPIEVVGFAVTAIGLIESPQLPRLSTGGSKPPEAAEIGVRSVFFEAKEPREPGTWEDTRVILREKLAAGNEVHGPAIIEEVSATTVLYPGDMALVHESGSVLVTAG